MELIHLLHHGNFRDGGFDMRKFFNLMLGAALLSTVAFAQAPAPIRPDDAVQIRYAANLALGESIIDLTNAGTNGGDDTTDFICANVYVFAQDQQLISCCACPLSPNDLQYLSVQHDLISNTLTPGVPTGVTIILTATDDTGQVGCDASTATTGFVGGLRAWGTTIHQAPLGALALTETEFSDVSLPNSVAPGSELYKMTSFCGFIESNGSGYGICNSCTSGAAGAAKKN
jgi:hypothetical protein